MPPIKTCNYYCHKSKKIRELEVAVMLLILTIPAILVTLACLHY